MKCSVIVGYISAALLTIGVIEAATFLDKPSLVTYWGQDSKNGINTQKPLAYYCDDLSDVIVISFTLNFRNGGLPDLNLAGTCWGPNFPGTNLLQCLDVGKDIKTCQSRGKTVLMSLGGAVGNYGFANNADAEAFADTLWNIYGAGSSNTRPFGDAILDGFDLDIEGGGPTGYAAMITRLRSHFATDPSKQYFITGAPQCPFPDAMMGSVIDAVKFDAVFVQFYNNYCSTTSNSFNFDTWDHWAKTKSPNKNVKVMLGLPGSRTAAGSGYVPFSQLQPIVQNVYKTYSSFGGIMIWDASQVYANTEVSPNYEAAVAGLVHGLSGGPTITTTTSTQTSTASTVSSSSSVSTKTTTTTTTTASPTVTPGTCPVNGAPCTNNGQYTCAGTSFATCNYNTWSLRSCPSGTTCFSTTDGTSVYCGPSTSEGNGSCTNSARVGISSVNANKGGPTAKPYKGVHTMMQLSVNKADANGFEAVVNARRLDLQSFKQTVTLTFKVANHVRITEVDQGTVSQRGNLVKLRIQNQDTESMALVVVFKGTISSGVFVAPRVDSMVIS